MKTQGRSPGFGTTGDGTATGDAFRTTSSRLGLASRSNRELHGASGTAMVAIVADAVAGFVMVVDDEVQQLYVARDYRGTGVATALLAEPSVRSSGTPPAGLARGRCRQLPSPPVL